MTAPLDLPPTTRPLDPQTLKVLAELRPGQRIRVTQTVRVGVQQWTTTVTGEFRGVKALVTGLATDRVRADDIVVPTVHFIKDNGELSSVALDENSKVELVTGDAPR